MELIGHLPFFFITLSRVSAFFNSLQGMPGGFLKHGTIALNDSEHYVLAFVPPKEDKELYELTMGGLFNKEMWTAPGL